MHLLLLLIVFPLLEVILRFARLVCRNVVLNVKKGDDMDIRNYVKVCDDPNACLSLSLLTLRAIQHR